MRTYMFLFITVVTMSLNHKLLLAQTGKNIDGPSTYGQQTYPNSGSTRSRTNLMGGRNSSTARSSDASKPSEDNEQLQEKQEQQDNNSIKLGPYNRDGEYQYLNHDENE